MILHAKQRIVLMLNAHDLQGPVGSVAPGRDRKLIAERVGLNDQAMVAGGLERIGKAFVSPWLSCWIMSVLPCISRTARTILPP